MKTVTVAFQLRVPTGMPVHEIQNAVRRAVGFLSNPKTWEDDKDIHIRNVRLLKHERVEVFGL